MKSISIICHQGLLLWLLDIRERWRSSVGDGCAITRDIMGQCIACDRRSCAPRSNVLQASKQDRRGSDRY